MAERKTFITTGTVAQNRKARFNYFIEERYEAGIVLIGPEVKSLRAGHANVTEAYVSVDSGELFLVNANISGYASTGYIRHVEARPRKLLLKKKEIQKIIGAVNKKGYTMIPLSIYFNNKGLAKIELGLALGKDGKDKRDTIKKRDWERQKARILRDNNK
ncbi:MAG: SsrA-binding protein [Alphaproteobacteria bacterium ADurb.Bin438]|nr:MAG: SsrA-binding protein [Alphaproteobacteria bacterium ADurb.Bin438]